MNKIRIVTDSAADLAPDPSQGLFVLPLTVRFGEETYLDGQTISHRQFFGKLIESDCLPSTSLPSPGDFAAQYQAARDVGEEVLVITVSSKLSGTYQSACLAAEDFPGQVAVVDSLTATIGQQLLLRYALELRQQGLSLTELAQALSATREEIHLLGLLDTLEYLQKGGRISKTAAVLGGALGIKPVVTVEQGQIQLLGKARGSRNGNNYLIKEIQKAGGVDFSRPYCLGYSGLSNELLQKYIQDSRDLWQGETEDLPICSIGATIGTHVGPGAIAVAFFAKKAN